MWEPVGKSAFIVGQSQKFWSVKNFDLGPIFLKKMVQTDQFFLKNLVRI